MTRALVMGDSGVHYKALFLCSEVRTSQTLHGSSVADNRSDHEAIQWPGWTSIPEWACRPWLDLGPQMIAVLVSDKALALDHKRILQRLSLKQRSGKPPVDLRLPFAARTRMDFQPEGTPRISVIGGVGIRGQRIRDLAILVR